MIVSRFMTKNPFYVSPDLPVSEARNIMNREKVGRLPVLDKNNTLVGIVTKKDLLKGGPSGATTLDMYEISYLLSKLKVEKLMTRNVITVQEHEVLEEAARIMADNDISCLPVLTDRPEAHVLTGIITAKDIFHAFLNAFGARHTGVRLTFSMEEKPGQLAKFSTAIAARGGNIVAFISQEGDDVSERRGTLKINGIDKSAVEEIAASVGAKLLDIR
jgi:acetoin utilization protein AcuB